MSEKEVFEPNEKKEECCHKKGDKDCKNKVAEFEDKIKILENSLEEKQKELEEIKNKSNQVLATASYYKNEADNAKKDFERFKERNKNFEAEAILTAKELMAKKLLPIIDNFDQAIARTTESVMKGFEMIYKSLIDLLDGLGIEEIKAEGDLDPEYHSCISAEPCEDESLDGKIATVYQKGYKFKETNKVVRPATVSVYKK